MTFPLYRGLHVVDSSSKAALGQTVFQAQINLGIMSLLSTSTVFGKLSNVWTEYGSLRYFRVKREQSWEEFKKIFKKNLYYLHFPPLTRVFITTTFKIWVINTLKYSLTYIMCKPMKERNGWKPLNLTATLKIACEQGTDFCTLKKVIKYIKRKVNVFCTYFYRLMTTLDLPTSSWWLRTHRYAACGGWWWYDWYT